MLGEKIGERKPYLLKEKTEIKKRNRKREREREEKKEWNERKIRREGP
jgi:hypothetical protein